MPDQKYIIDALREVKGDLGTGQIKHPDQAKPEKEISMTEFPIQEWRRNFDELEAKRNPNTIPVSQGQVANLMINEPDEAELVTLALIGDGEVDDAGNRPQAPVEGDEEDFTPEELHQLRILRDNAEPASPDGPDGPVITLSP
jgi:hypothetical protein